MTTSDPVDPDDDTPPAWWPKATFITQSYPIRVAIENLNREGLQPNQPGTWELNDYGWIIGWMTIPHDDGEGIGIECEPQPLLLHDSGYTFPLHPGQRIRILAVNGYDQ